MFGCARVERAIEHAIEYPKLFLIVRVAHAALFAASSKALLIGALTGFTVLIGELAADALGKDAIEFEAVGEGVTLALDTVFGGLAASDAAKTRRAVTAFNLSVSVIFKVFKGELQALLRADIPAKLGQ